MVAIIHSSHQTVDVLSAFFLVVPRFFDGLGFLWTEIFEQQDVRTVIIIVVLQLIFKLIDRLLSEDTAHAEIKNKDSDTITNLTNKIHTLQRR